MTVRRSLAEKIFLGAIRDRLLEPGAVRHVLGRVAEEIKKLSADRSGVLGRKTRELRDAEKRLGNWLQFVGDGRASDLSSVRAEIAQAEARVERLSAEVKVLRRPKAPDFRVPSEKWVVEQVKLTQALLERRTPDSARLIRRLLGQKVIIKPVDSGSGRPYYVASMDIDTLALVESGSDDPDSASPSLRWWRCPESNRGSCECRGSDGARLERGRWRQRLARGRKPEQGRVPATERRRAVASLSSSTTHPSGPVAGYLFAAFFLRSAQ